MSEPEEERTDNSPVHYFQFFHIFPTCPDYQLSCYFLCCRPNIRNQNALSGFIATTELAQRFHNIPKRPNTLTSVLRLSQCPNKYDQNPHRYRPCN